MSFPLNCIYDSKLEVKTKMKSGNSKVEIRNVFKIVFLPFVKELFSLFKVWNVSTLHIAVA